MAKIRITLLLFALGIGIPATALVLRAVESLDLENAYRHEAVAERVFDEMERSLSDFLLREEPRSPADYDVGLFPEGTPIASSSVFDRADEPFIVGWFAVDANGETRLRVSPSFDSRRIKSAVEAALGPGNPKTDTPESVARAIARNDKDSPAPGRTQSTGRARLRKKELAQSDDGPLLESSAYDVLQDLNRAQALRSERQSKARREVASKISPSAAPPAFAAAEAEMFAEADDARAAAPVEVDESRFGALGYAFRDEEGQIASGAAADSLSPRTDSTAYARSIVPEPAIIDPMIGRLTEAGDLVLTRSVWRSGRVDRQGLVLDRTLLVIWLRDRVLSETGLADRAQVDFATPDLPPRPDADHRYLHRFAEPFDGLVARLDLAPLAGLGSARPIYALAFLLIVVGAFGLFAVDRMTRVVVEYAQRRNDFVAAVSHELKTPLTAIRMYGEMLRDGLVGSEEKRSEYYRTITGESERLSRLIDNVLEFSRLDQDRRDLDLVAGELSSTVREAAEKLRAHVERADFELHLDLGDSLPDVRYDRDAITQILFNLVDNSLKYAREAERREIWICLARKGDHVELRVRDFGPGVPRDQLDRIFEPFYRVGEELTRTTEGTGIGLALVKELVEKSGGRLRASSPEDGGFVVVIEIDLAPSGSVEKTRTLGADSSTDL